MKAIGYDIICDISKYLSNKDKVRFTMTCVYLDTFRNEFEYTEEEHVYRVMQLPYYNKFTCVQKSQLKDVFTGSARIIHFNIRKPSVRRKHDALLIPNDVTHLTFYTRINENTKKYIPESVTHITLDTFFNKPIENCLPQSITHLTFGKMFNSSIKKGIPSMVTHVTFGEYFDNEIKNYIPNSVTYLTFGDNFNRSVDDLPQSVTHLTFGYYFKKSINNVPVSVVEIKLSEEYDIPIDSTVASRVRIIRV